jgi:hypothetical protein
VEDDNIPCIPNRKTRGIYTNQKDNMKKLSAIADINKAANNISLAWLEIAGISLSMALDKLKELEKKINNLI